MNTTPQHFYTPVFERDGNRFVYLYFPFVCGTAHEARTMGITADLTGMSAMTQAHYTGEVHRVDRNDRRRLYARGRLGGLAVSLIAGPLYEQALGHGKTTPQALTTGAG
jgi:hypothetical protein